MPFAVFLIAAAQWISRNPDALRAVILQGAAQGAPAHKTAAKSGEARSVSRLVPVYDAGIFAGRPVESAAAARAQDAPTAAPAESADGVPASPLAGNADGPVLTVGYDGIGFDRYLEIVESIGRFFVVLRSGDGIRLGPGISFRGGARLLPNAPLTMKQLATRHPHMVTDARIEARLASAELPANALRESLILLMTRPFDDLMWSVIEKEVGRHSLSPDDISAIHGVYEAGKDGAYLRLESATVRSDGRIIKLNRRLRVAL